MTIAVDKQFKEVLDANREHMHVIAVLIVYLIAILVTTYIYMLF